LENQTGDPALDAIGVMAGHWITQGLQRSGIVEVVPWPEALQSSRYVKSEANAGRVRTPIRALAVETGAATVVSGAYYRRGEAVQFHVEVTDANRSRSLGVLDPEVAQLVSLENAVEALRGRVMGLLAVTFDERLAAHARSVSRPPTFEAYQAFHQGMERYIGEEFRNAVTHFSRAFELDSTFALSLQFAAINLYAMRDYRRADSVLGVLARFRDQFTDLDAAWVDYLEAEFDGDHDRALQAIRRAAKLAPYSKAVYNRAHLALNTNRPREAVTALQSLDPERGAMRGWFGYWSVLCTALHETGDHERELEAARRAQELFPERALMAKFHAALALAALERFDELNELFDNMHLLPPVEGLPAGDMMRWTVNDLRGHGHHAAAQQVNTRAIEWFETQPPEQAATEIHRYYFGIVLYLARRWAEATRVFETLTHDFPENLNYRGYLGVLAARRGDPDRAMQIAEELQSVDRAYLFGLHTWWRARIQSVLGDFERAVALLREAGAQGHVEDWHTPVIDFESLQGYPPFRELTRLKG
jgi:tetratricopeptide (TPR) repeat protein